MDGDVAADVRMMDAAVDMTTDIKTQDNVATDSTIDTQDAADAAIDAVDESVDAGGPDVVDSGSDCGPLNTVQNCTACGAACDTLHSNNASCNGTTCLYQSCKMGWSNCDMSPPDLDGCECNTPSCCNGKCQTTHTNGIGQNYYDCVAQNTYNLVQGVEACAAYTGNQNACSMYTCQNPKDSLVCGSLNMKCACWDYNGVSSGHAYLSNNNTCYCPGSMDPTWN